MIRSLLTALLFLTTLCSFAQSNIVVFNSNPDMVYEAGETLTFTIIVTNTGPQPASNVTTHMDVPPEVAALFNFNNPAPVGIIRYWWTGSNGSSGTNVALNNVIATMAVNQSVTYTVNIKIPDDYEGTLPPVVVTYNSHADIVMVNTDNQAIYTPGTSNVYTLTVTNLGPDPAFNVAVSNPVPAGITNFTWTGSNGSAGTGALANTIPVLNEGQTVTYTITMAVPATFTGNLVSQASYTAAVIDPTPGCTQCTDTDLPHTADIVVVNTNNQNLYVPGAASVYTVTVTNNGPQAATNVHVVNAIPAGITGFSWVGSNGSSGTNANLDNTIATLAVGQTVTYTITLQVPVGYNAAQLASTTVVTSNTVDPSPGCPQCTDTDLNPATAADIVVVNTNNQTAYTPGTTTVYTLTVTNNGPNAATNVVVQNPVPAGITGFSWTGSNGSAGTGALNNTIPTLAVGQTVTYTITVVIPASFTGNLVSQASYSPAGTDPTPTCTQCVDTDVPNTGADIVVVNTNNQIIYTPGTTAVYTLTVTNNGPLSATNVQVTDVFSAGITSYSWTGSNGSSGTNTPLANTIPVLLINQTITYTITVNIPVGFTGPLNSLANVTSNTPDPTPECPSCSDTDYPSATADIVVVNTDNQTIYTPGAISTYTITVTNNGPSVATNVNVLNEIPDGIPLSSWTGSNGSSGTNADLANTIASLAVGQTVTYTLNLTVPVGYTGPLTSTTAVSSATADPDPTCLQCSDTDYNTPVADIVVTQTLNQGTTYTAGTDAIYTITVTNQGPSAAENVDVSSILPAGINAANVSWTGSNGTSGTGVIDDTIASLAVGTAVTYTYTIEVPSGYSQTTNLVNQIAVTSTTTDPATGCPQCTNTATPNPQANIVTVKTDNQTTYIGGQQVTYTITITNAGPSDASNITVTDPKPYQILVMDWSGNNDGGSGSMSDLIQSLPAGQMVQYTVVLSVPENYPVAVGPLINNVTVSTLTPDPVPACFKCNDTDQPGGDFVTVDKDQYTVPELVEDVLIDVDCADISNVTWQAGNINGNFGIGYFNGNNSNFPFQEGIIIRNGNAELSEGKFNSGTIVTSSAASSTGDAQLQAISNANGNFGTLQDVSYIQFDFVPLSTTMSFDFLFAANEYGTFQCAYSDVFGFILTDLTDGVPTALNIAVIPSTTIPISVTNIRNNLYNSGCPSANVAYFGQYNPANPANSAINMMGQTVVMTASATVQAGNSYRIKLAVGDYQDTAFDSAVFLEAGSFDIGQPDLPDDLLISTASALCPGDTYIIEVITGQNTDGFTYEWLQDGVPMLDENNQPITTTSLEVEEPGLYTVLVTNPLAPDCSFNADMLVEYWPNPGFNEAEDVTVCGNPMGTATFNLTEAEASILEGNPDPFSYEFFYYETEAAALAGPSQSIQPPYSYTEGVDGQTIYVSIQGFTNDCVTIKNFNLHIDQCGVGPQQPEPMHVCEIAPYNGIETFDLTSQNDYILETLDDTNYTLTFHNSLAAAQAGTPFINNPATYQGTTETIYIRVQDNDTPEGIGFTTLDLIVTPQPEIVQPDDVEVCSQTGYTLPAIPVGNYYTGPAGTGTQLAVGTVITSTQDVYIFATAGTAPYTCTDEEMYTVTVTPNPVVDEPGNVAVCDSYILPALNSGNYFTGPAGTGTALFEGDEITTTQNLYIYAVSGVDIVCTDEYAFSITINQTPELGDADPIELCDDNFDGVATFNLTAAVVQIVDGQANMTATLHNTQLDAENGASPQSITGYSSSTQTVYVRVVPTGTTTNCYAIAPVELIVNPKPEISQTSDYILCDDNDSPDGVEEFDLTTKGEEISDDPALTVSYYETQADAIAETSGIQNPDVYESGTNQEIWVRVEDANGCFDTTSFTLIVNPLPLVDATPDTYVLCEDAQGSGQATFDLASQTNAITLGNTTYGVVYYATQQEAATGIGTAITSPITTGSTTVYVRVTNSSTGCVNFAELELEVAPVPVLTPATLEVCDDQALPPNVYIGTFNLNTALTQITAGLGNVIATVHASQAEADLGTNDITDLASYNNTNSPAGAETLYVRVEQAGAQPVCYSVTTISLIVRAIPAIGEIEDYELCDMANSGDGVEVFDLTTKNDEVTTISGLTITYYENEGDAEDGVNFIINPQSYSNTNSPNEQEIYVRLESEYGCYSTDSFNIIVNPRPVIDTTLDVLPSCEEAPGVAIFDLSERTDDVTFAASGYNVSYYQTQTEAETGVGTPLPTIFTSPSQVIWVRVEDVQTGCYSATTLALQVMPAPIAQNPDPLEECDDNNDNVAHFDLSPVMDDIVNDLGAVTVTFHETQEDAEFFANQIQNITDYTNVQAYTTNGVQTLFVTVRANDTDCYDIVELQLIVHPIPVATEPEPYEVCDDNTDGEGIFDLTTRDAEVLGTINPALFSVEYYTTQDAAMEGISPIPNPASYPSVSTTVFVRVENNATDCFDIVELELIVNPLPVANDPTPYSLCDVTNQGDETEEFDLTTKIPEIIGTQEGINVTFYHTYEDAQAQTNPETDIESYENDGTVETLFVRVTVEETGCYRIVLLDVRVEPLPQLTMPSEEDRTVCDPDGDGIAEINLFDLVEGMINNGENITVAFYETEYNAQNGLSPIPNPESYVNQNAFSQVVWIVAENTVTGCRNDSAFSLEIIIVPSPELPDLEDLVLCDEDANDQNSITAFDLTSQNEAILAAPGMEADYIITYYTNPDYAQEGAPRITNDTNFPGTDGQMIWVRVEHPVTGCFGIGSFTLEVNRPLELVAPPMYTVCNTLDTPPMQEEFDLTTMDSTILGPNGVGQGFTVTYFASVADLESNTPITNPEAYTNVLSNPQTLQVMVTTTDGCRSYTTLTIKVLPLPTPNMTPDALEHCDDNASPDGLESFDLTDAEQDIRDNDQSTVLTYHLTQEDADQDINAIADPTNHVCGNAIIYVRVEANTNNPDDPKCYRVVELQLIVHPLPALGEAGVIPPYAICEPNTDGYAVFNLNTHNDEVIAGGDTTGYTFKYFLTEAYAQAGAPALPLEGYTNEFPNQQTVWVRVENDETDCTIISSFDLLVELEAVANEPADGHACDDADGVNDGIATYDLTQFTAEVLGATQPEGPGQFLVEYYETDPQTDPDATPIADPVNYRNETSPDLVTIYIRAYNDGTISKCSDYTSVEIIIEQLPRPVLQGGTICVDFSGAVLRTHTLDTGLPADHTFVWYHDGVVIPGATGPTYDADAQGDYTVIATSPLGCVSLPIAPVSVEQSGPASPIGTGYTVSNYFSDEQVVTINVEGYGVYEYKLDDGPWQESNVFTNVSAGTHEVQVRDTSTDNPCSEFILPIEGVSLVDYPEYFTPNGDGYHDTWNIRGFGDENADAKIYIFDRYGKLVKQIGSQGEGWDGTMNGNPVPATDYWFTVTYREMVEGQEVTKEFKAHFALKR